MGPLRPFDRAIELGAFRRQHEQPDPPALALGFKRREEFGPAVPLDGADGKGHARLHGVQKLRGQRGGGPPIRLQDIPARDHIAGGKLFEDDPRQGADIEGVELDEVAAAGRDTRSVCAWRTGGWGGVGEPQGICVSARPAARASSSR